MMENYLTVSEMEKVIAICKAMDALYEANGGFADDSVSIPASTFEGLEVTDVNGAVLGAIGMTDDGTFGLYVASES